MKIRLLTLFLVISLTGSAWARLGETEQQLIARYGDVSSRNHFAADRGNVIAVDQLAFTKSGFNIVVVLFNGVSAEETILTAQGDVMTDQEIKTLLDANAQAHTWKEVLPKNGGIPWPQDNGTVANMGATKMWQRDDGAVANAGGNSLTIKSKELIDAQVTAYKAAHVHSLEGF